MATLEDMPGVRALFAAGMTPYADQFPTGSPMHKMWLRYVQKALGEDISDQGVKDTYLEAGGGLWVAEDLRGSKALLGCVAGQRISDTDCELRRMSVCASTRGRGLGKLLCWHLEDWAVSNGFRHLTHHEP